MANSKDFNIDIVIAANTAQAEQAEQALGRITNTTNKSTVANKKNADSTREMGDRSQGAMDVIEGLTRASQGGIGAIGDMDLAVRGLSDIVLGGGPFALIAGGLAAVATSAVVAIQHVRNAKKEIREMGDEAATTREKLTDLDNVELNFTKDIDSLTELINQFETANSQADKLISAKNRLQGARIAQQLQQVNLQESQQLAGATTDPQRQSIRLDAQNRRMLITSQSEQDAANAATISSQENLQNIEKSILHMGEQLEITQKRTTENQTTIANSLAQAQGLGITSDASRRLQELQQLRAKPGQDLTPEQRQRLSALKLQEREDIAESTTGTGSTFQKARAELEQERKKLIKEYNLATQVATAEAGIVQQTAPEILAAFEKSFNRIDNAMRLITELPTTISKSAASIEESTQQAKTIQQRIEIARADLITASIDVTTAQTAAQTAQAKTTTATTTQTTAQTQFKAQTAANAEKLANQARLRILQNKQKGLLEQQKKGFPNLQENLETETLQSAEATEALESFQDTPLGPRNTLLSRSGQPYQQEIARLTAAATQQESEMNQAAQTIVQSTASMAATVKDLANQIKNIELQIKNGDN